MSSLWLAFSDGPAKREKENRLEGRRQSEHEFHVVCLLLPFQRRVERDIRKKTFGFITAENINARYPALDSWPPSQETNTYTSCMCASVMRKRAIAPARRTDLPVTLMRENLLLPCKSSSETDNVDLSL